MICMGFVLNKNFKRIVYGATLQDSSKYVVQEVETDTKELARLSNCDIEVVSEVERELAVKVLREWAEKNN